MTFGLLIRLKLRNHWFCTILHGPWFAHQIKIAKTLVCTILHGPWFAHQIKIAKPLGLHYIAWPFVCSSDKNCKTIGSALYCMALGLYIRLKLRNNWVCTILHDPWYAHQIKIAKPLVLHYIAWPVVCSSD